MGGINGIQDTLEEQLGDMVFRFFLVQKGNHDCVHNDRDIRKMTAMLM